MKKFLAALLLALATSSIAIAQPAGIIVNQTPLIGGSTGQCLARNANGTVGAAGCATTFSGGTTGLTPSSPTSGPISLGGVLVGANGGTGVANSGKTITLGGNLTTSGAFNATFVIPGTGSWTFPVAGSSLAPLASPSFTTPALGVATATSINGNTITSGTGTLTLGSATLNAGAGGTLGSNAFTSTAYLPIAGGTLTGNLALSTGTTLTGPGGLVWSKSGTDETLFSINAASKNVIQLLNTHGDVSYSAIGFWKPGAYDYTQSNMTLGYGADSGNTAFQGAYLEMYRNSSGTDIPTFRVTQTSSTNTFYIRAALEASGDTPGSWKFYGNSTANGAALEVTSAGLIKSTNNVAAGDFNYTLTNTSASGYSYFRVQNDSNRKFDFGVGGTTSALFTNSGYLITESTLSGIKILPGGTLAATFGNTGSTTFSGTVTFPSPFTLGATSVTSTGTQLNYLNAATGTTGTTSTNVVFSTNPTLVTPAIGAATGTSLALGGATLGTNVLAVTGTTLLGNVLVSAGVSPTVQLGGTTSSFPMLKRSGQAVHFKTADDANFSTVSMGPLIVQGGGTVRLSGDSLVSSGLIAAIPGADATLLLTNSTQSSFTRLVLGGTLLSIWPALVVNGAALQVKVADDSAFAPLTASLFAVGALTTWPNNQTCTAGQHTWDANFLYVCTSTNVVKRAALSTF